MRKDFILKAVKILSLPKGTVQQKMGFLKQKGLTDLEITEALNQATNGEVVRSAFSNL